MIPNASSQPPTRIDPPTGAFEVYEFDRATDTARLVGTFGDDNDAAHKAMRTKAGGCACTARGGVVLGVKYGTPTSQIAAMKAAVKAAHASNTTRPVEPPAAPVAPTKTDRAEEPMPEEIPPCEAKGCTDHRAGVRTDTRPALVPFCRADRKKALDRVRDWGLSISDAAQTLRDGLTERPEAVASSRRKAPAKPSKAEPVTRATKPSAAVAVAPPESTPIAASATPAPAPLADALVRVKRQAAAIARLGGVEAAEQLAAIVADAGGAAVVVEALTTLRSLS